MLKDLRSICNYTGEEILYEKKAFFSSSSIVHMSVVKQVTMLAYSLDESRSDGPRGR